MVKALIATAILAAALIFGGYALEQTRTPSAAAQSEHAEKGYHGCNGDQQRGPEGRGYKHGDRGDRGRGEGWEKDKQRGRDEDRGGDDDSGENQAPAPYHHGGDGGFSHPAPSNNGWWR